MPGGLRRRSAQSAQQVTRRPDARVGRCRQAVIAAAEFASALHAPWGSRLPACLPARPCTCCTSCCAASLWAACRRPLSLPRPAARRTASVRRRCPCRLLACAPQVRAEDDDGVLGAAAADEAERKRRVRGSSGSSSTGSGMQPKAPPALAASGGRARLQPCLPKQDPHWHWHWIRTGTGTGTGTRIVASIRMRGLSRSRHVWERRCPNAQRLLCRRRPPPGPKVGVGAPSSA